MSKSGSSKNALVLGLLGLVILLSTVTASVVFLIAHQSSKNNVTNQSCSKEQQTKHVIIIQNDVAKPSNTVAHQCDTLTIVNKDDETREIAFGLHEDHIPYDGVSEKFLHLNEFLIVTLIQTGNFRVHDHVHDEVQATFAVYPK